MEFLQSFEEFLLNNLQSDYSYVIYRTIIVVVVLPCLLILLGHCRYLFSHDVNLPAKVMAVLGSGGHTREMMSIMQSLSPAVFTPRIYVYSKQDDLSKTKAQELETSINKSQFTLECIARSRKVGQSFFTSIFTTLYSMIGSFVLVLRTRPDIIICNGPGVCVPIIYSAVILKFLGLFRPKIIFVESICRVKSLSLTGKLVYPVVNIFIVQWEEMHKRFKGATYIGRIC